MNTTTTTRSVSAVPRPRPAGAPPVSIATSAAARAAQMRSEHLLAVHAGILTVHDVIEAAAKHSGVPLRKLTLRQLLLAVEGQGERRVDQKMSSLRAKLGVETPSKELTVGWLVDPRAGGRRWLAWADLHQPTNDAPWPGFPWAPPDVGSTEGN